MGASDDGQVCMPEHCFHAFDALYCSLTKAELISPSFPDEKYPLFVTWNTCRPGRSPRLRGCIGSFEPHALHEGIADYALISAFRDHRFSKIQAHELSSLECGISLLTDFEDASGYLDWEVGTHGIYISFPHPSTLTQPASDAPSPLSSATYLPRVTAQPAFTATYLPEVAPEQGWDRRTAVDSAIRKAGWSGRITEDLRRSIRLRRYQSRKCTVSWEEYVAWRQAKGGEVDPSPA
ncbi:AMMECR1 domain-containing protein [Vararia minispora EC-137]|uniref:AMMECR1 domain-containing protein n=1 Tax=Vararia minispora EC-137 TaxID=1314806 RepID=A0ACB8QRY3_9AGAM|nr:AMMECR1 domain-containing protein [Vararia minispora EC-137]